MNSEHERHEMIQKLTNLREVSIRSAKDILGSLQEAEDAVQEALATGSEKLSQLRDPTKISGWFNAIVVNECRERKRRQRAQGSQFSLRDNEVSDRVQLGQHVTESPVEDDPRLMCALTEKQRQIIERLAMGKSEAEIREELKISKHAFRGRRKNAETRIRQIREQARSAPQGRARTSSKSTDSKTFGEVHDVFTPKLAPRIADAFSLTELSSIERSQLMALGKSVITATAEADCQQFVEIGDYITRAFDGHTAIRAFGHYLTAEGKRLLPVVFRRDFGGLAASMNGEALKEYGIAVDLDPSPRNLRGLGKACQIDGDQATARQLYSRVVNTVRDDARKWRSPTRALNQHELMRASRHRIDLDIAGRLASGSVTGVNPKNDPLVEDIKECISFHDAYLAKFCKSNESWGTYETFMAHTFLGIATSFFPEAGNALWFLGNAINAKRNSMKVQRVNKQLRYPTEQDFQNFAWTLSGFESVIERRSIGPRAIRTIQRDVESLRAAINQKDGQQLLSCTATLSEKCTTVVGS
ncbi:RNA polymerase sigma factor [Crateriforma conspicua]|uniref:RNA polymerase sigma factor n=1 Tax=Crateriforma conspicua TaxID=2527996 RepID=A0A5C6FJC1_9PLAN|nr:sigma-70 family RNA polymerase sigma factor [Crateriforma conspicua]TWU62345.1 RNA polymerase sigma factor [Crateriforma conspicua]